MNIEQFFLGSYLGDGCFIKKSDKHNTYCTFKHCESQLEYLKWKYSVVRENGLTNDKHKGIVEVNIKPGTCFPNHQRQFRFSTISTPELNRYKCMTVEEIADMFSEEAFVVWLLDDGNVHKKRIKIACGSLPVWLCYRLVAKLLVEFEFDAYFYEHPTKRTKNYIVIREDSYDDVSALVHKHIPNIDVVMRKFGF